MGPVLHTPLQKSVPLGSPSLSPMIFAHGKKRMMMGWGWVRVNMWTYLLHYRLDSYEGVGWSPIMIDL